MTCPAAHRMQPASTACCDNALHSGSGLFGSHEPCWTAVKIVGMQAYAAIPCDSCGALCLQVCHQQMGCRIFKTDRSEGIWRHRCCQQRQAWAQQCRRSLCCGTGGHDNCAAAGEAGRWRQISAGSTGCHCSCKAARGEVIDVDARSLLSPCLLSAAYHMWQFSSQFVHCILCHKLKNGLAPAAALRQPCTFHLSPCCTLHQL